jgi:excisionase family DNA binding protein
MVGSFATTNGATHDDSSVNGNLLTVTQVAELLNAHPHSVRRWADSGLLDCYRIGFRGDRRFKPDDVDAFLLARIDNSNAC